MRQEPQPGRLPSETHLGDPQGLQLREYRRRALGSGDSVDEMGVRSRIELPAGEFSYVEAGTGPPIVFLHALGRNALDWAPVFRSLSKRWRCIALDLRGHGESVRCERYSFADMERDVRAFVDSLDLSTFSMVAHSMGANVAWLFAARTPDRIYRLVIEDTAPPSPAQTYPEPPEQSPQPVDFDWNVVGQIIGQLNRPDPSWWDGPSKVTTPTLLISGSANDSLLLDVQAKLPAGQLIHIDVGHHIHQTAPARFNETVEAFLGQAGEGASPA